LGLEERYGIDRYEWFGSTWNLNPKDFLKPDNKKPLFDSLDAKIAILTAAPRVWASQARDYLGLAEYQSMLFTGEPDLRKPNPEAFRQICDSVGIPPEKSISIGDQVASDILPAKTLGMKTILVRSYSDEADYCIDSLEDLSNLLWRTAI
jgi:HAD superfamily hydrolase (TIGR01549 family)